MRGGLIALEKERWEKWGRAREAASLARVSSPCYVAIGSAFWVIVATGQKALQV